MGLKYDIPYDLDSPERTIHHKEIIKGKKFLLNLYINWYSIFTEEIKQLPKGKLVELGSGGGFLKELAPEVICSDIIDLPGNDMTFSALEMPFDNGSLSGIFMIDTMHHIPDSEKFLKEVQRTLKSGGKMVMIEPANSFWGRFIYKNFHHEPFEPTSGWTIPQAGPLSGANGSLPWIVFERDKELFNKKFPDLKIEEIRYIHPLMYLLSGGVSYKQLLPDFLYKPVLLLDTLLSKISPQISMFMVVKVVKE